MNIFNFFFVKILLTTLVYVNKKLKAKFICQHTIKSVIEYIFLEIQNPIMEKNLLIG